MPKLKKIKWDVTGNSGTINNQWHSTLQFRNGVTIMGIIDFDGTSTYTVTSTPSGAAGTASTLKLAKNIFRKYLFNL